MVNLYGVFVHLLLLTAQVYATTGLQAPNELKHIIKGNHVLIEWSHSRTNEPIDGYYVSVQEVLNTKRLGSPDFIHVEPDVHSAEIQGLKPDAVYEIKVVAYTDIEHKSSTPLIVRTKTLELMTARNLTVSDITSTAALFQWEHDAINNVHDVQFKLTCSGLRQFTDKDNKLVEEDASFEHTSFSTSRGRESHYTNQLEPNTKYSCQMVSIAGTLEGPPYGQMAFITNPGVPTPPPTPKLYVQESSFTAELYHTDDRFGAISHYKVFAVPMVKGADQPVSAPYTPTVPVGELFSSAVTSELVSETPDAIPFIVGSYKPHKLPKQITFDGQMMKKSFKPKTYYSIIVAAFSQTKDTSKSENLYSLSAAAEPPVFISADMQEEWMAAHDLGPVKKRFTTIVVSTLLSVTLLFALAFLLAFGSHYYTGKKRDAYFFTVSHKHDDSSEDELYSRKTPLKGSPDVKERVALLKLSPQPPSASKYLPDELADNMCHNPAFEEMVYHSPDAMKEVRQLTQQSEQKAAVQTALELNDPDIGQGAIMQVSTSQQSPTIQTLDFPNSPDDTLDNFRPSSPLEGPSTAIYAKHQRKRV